LTAQNLSLLKLRQEFEKTLTMKGEAIENIISSDPQSRQWFQGFSSPDLQIPQPVSWPALYVLNTDVSDGPGRHWCLAILFSNGVCEFFDPLGRSPGVYKFHKPIFKHCEYISFNEYPVQSLTSTVCAHHCLFFIYHRVRGLTASKVMRKYSTTDTELNDRIVYTFIRTRYGDDVARVE